MVHAGSVAFPVLASHRISSNSLFKSMRRLSTGQRILHPGDNSADYGISQNLRMEIKRTSSAKRNVENMNDMLRSTADWMQVGNEILKRMGELSIASLDGSKQQSDRAKLDLEYQQLKKELTRISQQARYNSLQVVGRDQLLTYDKDRETFFFAQLDGQQSYPLPVKVLSGIEAKNRLDFYFDDSKDFTLSGEGDSVYYVDSNNHLVRYNIEEGTLDRDTADSESKKLDVDDEGRLWYAAETTTGSGVYSLRQQNLNSWTQDTLIVDSSSISDMALPEFRVYENRVYYVQDGTNDLVSRSLMNNNDIRIELPASEFTLNLTDGEFTIAEDGRYVADVSSTGTVRLINVESRLFDTFETGATTIKDLSLSVDSNAMLFNSLSDNSIYSVEIEDADQPRLSHIDKIQSSDGQGFAGLSLDAKSHQGRVRLHSGPHHSAQTFFNGADLRMYALGLARTDVSSVQGAELALRRVNLATETVNQQRSILGAAESRFGFSHEGLENYENNIHMADSRLRDVNIPLETSIMTGERVKYEAATALLVQANSLSQVALQLLSR